MANLEDEKELGSSLPSSSSEPGSGFSARLKEAIGSQSVLAFSKKCGISDSLVRKYLSGSLPGLDKLVVLAEAAGVRVGWLATGEEPMMAGEVGQYEIGPSEPLLVREVGEYVHVPLYNVQAAAGHGSYITKEDVVDSVSFKKSWINNVLHRNANDLYLISVEGESMEPTLKAGDLILVDHRDAETVPRDGIYVLRMGDTLMVKRLQRLPGRRVRATSDNAAYEPFELSLDDTAEDMAIIGLVVWSGGRM